MTRIRVYEARNSVEAHMALAALLAAGVEARAEANHLLGTWGDEALPVTVWVQEDQLSLARRVLVNFKREGAEVRPEGPTWACEICGEVSGPTFGACWKCSTTRP